jgi:hypothetical protein
MTTFGRTYESYQRQTRSRLTLKQLAKEYSGTYPVKLKEHDGRRRLIVTLAKPRRMVSGHDPNPTNRQN